MNRYFNINLSRMRGNALLILIAVLFFPNPVFASISDDSIKLHEEAKSYLEKGNFKSAVIQLKNAIRADPNNVQARYDLAAIYLRGRDGASAEKELKAARKRGMEETKILLPLAQAYSLQGKNQTVLDEISPDGRPDSLSAGILAARAGAYMALERLGDAKSALEKAVKLAPEKPIVFEALSQVLQASGDMIGAEKNIDRALSLVPDNPRALVRKAGIRQTRGDIEAATEFYTKALALSPGNTAALIGRASAMVAANKDSEAAKDIDAVLQDSAKNPIAVYLSALLLAREKKFDAAMERLQSVGDILANYPPANYLTASLSFAQGRIEQAQSYIQRYLAKQDESPRGKRLLAAIYLRKKNAPAAIKILEPMVKLTPDDPRLLTLLGNAYVANRQNAKAGEIYQRVITEAPDNQSARTRLALTHLNTGDSKSAVKEFETILEQDPDATRANLFLVLTHLRNRNFGPASEAVQALKKRLPDSPMPYNFQGTINLARSQTEEAKKNFQKALEMQSDFYPAALNLGEIERAAGNFEKARELYQSILKTNGTHLQAMLRLSQIEQSQNNREEAEKWLTSAVKFNPDATQARLRLVNFLLQSKKLKQALSEARAFTQASPKNPDALDALARTQFAVGQKQNAVASYRQLATIAPDSAVVHHRLGRSLATIKNYRDAKVALDRAIVLNPRLGAAQRDRIRVENLDKGASAAISLTQSMIAAKPKEATGYAILGDLLFSEKKFAEATAQYQKANDITPTGQMITRLYQSNVRSGKSADAQKTLTDWLASHPDDNEIRFLYASSLIAAKDYKGAISENEKLLQKFPKNAAILNDLAWLYGEVNDKRAIPYAERAHALQPNSAAIADTLGWLLLNAGQSKESLPILKDAHEKAPTHPEIGYHYAVSLNEAGQKIAARETIKAILDTGKKFSDIIKARDLYKKLLQK
jgi:putative PEP-CTERM system TPR-repeat lipoprotein